MSKRLSKALAFLAMLVMIVMTIPVQALADQTTTERMAVHVQVPDDWSNPCAWAWNEDGTNAFESWPGEAFETDASNDGWYYIWVPTWANHVIVNANDGSVQTQELILEEKESWIQITSAEEANISYDKQTTGDTPEYVEKFAIHAKVSDTWATPCLWAWSAPDGTNAFESWPGEAMTQEENGWYTMKAPVWVNSIIVNANAGSVQTEDISIDPAELWLTIDEAGAYELSYKNPDQADIPNITVRVMAPQDWAAPCLWAWSAPDGTNVFANWPGEALTEDENGWLKMEVPGWVNSIIVNANDGSVQTSDLSIDAGKDVWVVVNSAEDAAVTYEEPKVDLTDTTEPETDTSEASAQETKNAKDTNWGAIIAVILIVAAVVVVVVVIVLKKKKGATK